MLNLEKVYSAAHRRKVVSCSCHKTAQVVVYGDGPVSFVHCEDETCQKTMESISMVLVAKATTELAPVYEGLDRVLCEWDRDNADQTMLAHWRRDAIVYYD